MDEAADTAWLASMRRARWRRRLLPLLGGGILLFAWWAVVAGVLLAALSVFGLFFGVLGPGLVGLGILAAGFPLFRPALPEPSY